MTSHSGIWTKHLKSTELHQSIITRVLKSLEKKGLIKSIKSVKVRPFSTIVTLYSQQSQHPTRKIYILANLQPSVEVSGGPWYNNSEFETEFVQTLCNACLNFIQKRVRTTPHASPPRLPRMTYPQLLRPVLPYTEIKLETLPSRDLSNFPVLAIPNRRRRPQLSQAD